MMTSTHTRGDRPGVQLTARIIPPKQDGPWTARVELVRPAGATTSVLTLDADGFDTARYEVRAFALAALQDS